MAKKLSTNLGENSSISSEKNESKTLSLKKKADAKLSEEAKKADRKRERFKKERIKLAQKFSDEVVKKFSKVVKAVIIFGSFSRNDFTEKSDIDVLVVIDDTEARFTPEMRESFDAKIRETGKKIHKDIVVQPSWTLTEFWDMARIGHPLLYTIVRDGWALYDTGFFIPVRKLLEAGKVPHTLEAIELLMHGAPKKIDRVENAKLYMIAEDLYYAMLNSSQAVLMFLGKNLPTPKYTHDYVKQYLVDTKMLSKKHFTALEQVIRFRKDVEHKKIKNITGEKLDMLIKKSRDYVEQMQKILFSLEMKKKDGMIVRNYEVMIKGVVAGLKTMGKLPKDPKELPAAMKKHLIDSKKIDPFYESLLKRVAAMRKMIDEKKSDKIPSRDVELTREYVRRFIRDMDILLKGRENLEKSLNEGNEQEKK